MSDAIPFQRKSLTDVLAEIKKRGPGAQGVAVVFLDKDGKAAFRLSGFDGPMDRWTLCGLLDWVKADLMSDVT